MVKTTRSPLKENDPNMLNANVQNSKKRSLNLLELEQSNRIKQRNLRTIEGAIAHAPDALLKSLQGTSGTFNMKAGTTKARTITTPGIAINLNTAHTAGPTNCSNTNGNEAIVSASGKIQTQRLSNRELVDWQNNWRRIMRKDTYIYFDCSETVNDSRKELLRRAFLSLGAKIKQFFDHEVTIVITSRKPTNHLQLPDTDILHRAHKRGYMKIWTLEKATRFLSNMDVDLKELEKNTALPASNLLNLLESEKLFGTNDRDPKAKRDDLHYFRHPHVYLYDLGQINAPLITLEWKAQDLANKKKPVYPMIRPGSFGRCPFQGDDATDEQQPRRIIKRYKRDEANEAYAMKLRLLYQNCADPLSSMSHIAEFNGYSNDNEEKGLGPIIIPYSTVFNNSKTQYNQLINSKPRFKQPKLPRGDTFDEDDILQNPGLGYKNKFQQEIRASGVQSVETNSNGNANTGNGLEPVKASNLNKSLQSLKKMVIERKSIGTPNVKQPNGNQITYQRIHQPMGKQSSGYCENCKVKYDNLENHIKTEKHMSFANNEDNFDGVDSMILSVQQFRKLNVA